MLLGVRYVWKFFFVQGIPILMLLDFSVWFLLIQFEALAFGSTAMCGRNTFWFWVISAVPFYCATWEKYVDLWLMPLKL